MKPLQFSLALVQEFATVDALWNSNGSTRRVDALLLCWVKYEKQLRRLFCFLVFQHPHINEKTVEQVVSVLVENNDLYPETFIKGIAALKVTSVEELLGASYQGLQPDMKRIKAYRNKLMHGQVTGKKISSRQIERDVGVLIHWVSALAAGAEAKFGYDGIRRNTYRSAKASATIAVDHFPFSNATEFRAWLRELAK